MGIFRHRTNDSKLVNKPLHNQVVEVSDYSIWRLIGEIRNLQTSNNYKYAEYDIMAQDTIIKAALHIYADFAVQTNDETNKILEVVSDNEVLAKDINSFLDKFKIEQRLWTLAYQLAKYGDVFWKVLLSTDNKNIAGVESIDDPSSVVDLYLHGEPAYYAYNPDDRAISKTVDYQLFDRKSFVHFTIKTGEVPDTIEITSNDEVNEITHRPLVVTYKIHTGESMLEGVRAIYRIIKALEDSIIAASIARAEYTKIYNVEVGPDTNEIDARKMINKVKRLFDSRMAMDVREGQESASTYMQPRSFMDPIFNSVSGGKGAISIETDGGTIEVTNLTHLDYFNKLKFSGLHITPSMLAFEDNLSAGLGDKSNSMMYQDIRLAMYVKKLINGILEGITDLVNTWLKVRGRDKEIGKFTIRTAVPSAAESMANLEELSQTLEYVDKLSEVIAKNAPGINSSKVTDILLDEYVKNKSLLDKLKPLINEATKVAEMEQELAKAEVTDALDQFDKSPLNNPPLVSDELTSLSLDELDLVHPIRSDNYLTSPQQPNPLSRNGYSTPAPYIPEEIYRTLVREHNVSQSDITHLRLGQYELVDKTVLTIVAQLIDDYQDKIHRPSQEVTNTNDNK